MSVISASLELEWRDWSDFFRLHAEDTFWEGDGVVQHGNCGRALEVISGTEDALNPFGGVSVAGI